MRRVLTRHVPWDHAGVHRHWAFRDQRDLSGRVGVHHKSAQHLYVRVPPSHENQALARLCLHVRFALRLVLAYRT